MRAGLQARLGTHLPGSLGSPHNPCGTGQRGGGERSSHVDAQTQPPKHRQRGFQPRFWLLIWFQTH